MGRKQNNSGDYYGTECSVEGCTTLVRCRGLCAKHYARVVRHGDPLVTKAKGPIVGRTRRKPGRRYVDTGGYVTLYYPDHPNAQKNGCVKEHIYVMSQLLGRRIRTEAGENIHHMNGDRHDNSLSNLELWNTSQPRGQRVEDKIEFYKHFLESYGYIVSDGKKECE